MSWLSRVRNGIQSLTKRQSADNLWHKCRKCESMVFTKEWEDNGYVCPRCDHHDRVGPKVRFDALFDRKKYELLDSPEVKRRPAQVPRHQALHRSGQGRSLRDGRARRADQCDRQDRGTYGGGRGAGLRLHGRVDGRRGRRGLRRRRRAGDHEALPLCPVHRRRRRADAGRHIVADADAADDGSAGAASRGGPPLYRRPHRSRRRAGSRRAMRCSAMSRLPNRAHSSALPGSG